MMPEIIRKAGVLLEIEVIAYGSRDSQCLCCRLKWKASFTFSKSQFSNMKWKQYHSPSPREIFICYCM